MVSNITFRAQHEETSDPRTLLEWTDYQIVLQAPAELPDPRHYRASVNGQALPGPVVATSPGGSNYEICWRWGPKEVGEYDLELRTPFGDLRLNPRVIPSRIASSEYAHLLADLQRLPYEIVFALETARGADPVELRAYLWYRSPADEIEYVRRAIEGDGGRPGLETVLPRIAADPHKRLSTTEEIRPSWKTKRASRHSLRWLLRNHEFLGLALEPAEMPGAGIALGSRRFLPTHLPALEKDVSHDCQENRLIKLFLRLLRLRLEWALSVAETDPTFVADNGRVLRRKITALERVCASFLSDVRLDRHLTLRPTMVLARESRYSAVYQGYLDFMKRTYVEFAEQILRRRTKDFPTLYEIWSTLKVVDAVLPWANERGYRVTHHRLYERPSSRSISFSIPSGSGLPLLGIDLGAGWHLRLYAQRSYSPGGDGGRARAVASRQVPDISVEVVDEKDHPRAMLILDAKYKLASEVMSESAQLLGSEEEDLDLEEVREAVDQRAPVGLGTSAFAPRPKKVDIDKMHTYRDAIRGPEGEPLVMSAHIIYPGETVGYPEDHPLVGALGVRPGNQRLEDELRINVGRLLDELIG